MTRILLCGDVPFPRGSAGSNLTLCFAKLFREIGYDVVYIGLDSHMEDVRDEDSGLFKYRGIKYSNVTSGSGLKGSINVKLLSGKNTVKKLKELNACKDDIVVIYATNSAYIKPILNYAHSKSIKTVCFSVEWHMPFQYRFGKYDIRYISSSKALHKYIPESGNIIVLSKLQENFYKEKNHHVVRVPMLIDSIEDGAALFERKLSPGQTRNFVYAGDPGVKDDLRTVLKGILLLDKEERSKMVFHWVGMSPENARANLGEDGYLLDELADCVKVHNRLSFDELLKFYKDMDFLVLARDDNNISNGGFPSKVPEAMLQGIVPIIIRVGDCPSYLSEGEDAFIFDKNTPESCCEALKKALSISEEALYDMRKATYESCKRIFDYNQWTDTVSEFLNNLQ